jgi:hypothetical protein
MEIKTPEFLKGKEVKEFRQLSQELIGTWIRHNSEDILCQFLDIIDFYSLPLNPEDIPKLFKGWSKSGGLYFILHKYNIDFSNKAEYWKFTKDSVRLVFSAPIPRTLNEFISDCDRAGIKLTWKE